MAVKIVFHANKPMWVGLVIGLLGIFLAIVYRTALPEVEALWPVSWATMILGALVYLMGRAIQIMKKRY